MEVANYQPRLLTVAIKREVRVIRVTDQLKIYGKLYTYTSKGRRKWDFQAF